jgi:transposase InsO family protein
MQMCHHDSRSRNQLVQNPSVQRQTSNHCRKHRVRGMVFLIPWPTQVTFDRGSEFIGHEFKKMLNEYGVKKKRITIHNPQANAIVKGVHQTIGNIIRTFELHENYLDEDDP